MKLSIMQPYFFPYIGYFQLINASDKFVIYDDVTYIKGGWISRNKILSNDKEIYFNADIKNNKSSTLIKDIPILKNSWKKKRLKTLYYIYNKSKNFKSGFEVIESCFSYDTNFLSEFNFNAIKTISDYLNINTDIVQTSTVYNNSHLKSQNRVLDICTKEKAKTYINTSGGINLYSFQDFNKKNIELNFIRSKELEISNWNLSIIHLILTFEKEKVISFLDAYDIIKEA